MGDPAAGSPAFCRALETLAIAYHEAGHAVAQLLVCPALPLTNASIAPEGDELGRACFENYAETIVPDADGEDADMPEHERQYLESEAISLLAGPLAEQRFCGQTLEPPLPGSARTDQADVTDIAHLLHDDRRVARAWVGSMLRRAIDLVQNDGRFWPAVKAAAAALLREQTLTSDEISTLVHETTERTRR